MTDQQILELAKETWHRTFVNNSDKELLAFAHAIEAATIERAARVFDEMVLYTGCDCAAVLRGMKE